MRVTYRVKNSENNTVGFMIDERFYNINRISTYINSIDNLREVKPGVFRGTNKIPVVKYSELMKNTALELNKANPFKRDIQYDLLQWKNDGAKQVLRLLGPRQSGKTTELRRFAYSNYENIIYINLADDRHGFMEMLQNRETNLEWSHSILASYCNKANLSAFINDRRTILIIDEIQLSTKCYNSIRSLREEYNIDIIITGSYLAITFTNKEYFPPMGTLRDMTLLPLSFSEFCNVFGKRKILENVNMFNELPTKQHKDIDKLYEVYRQIGGYPEVIKTFIDTKDIVKTQGMISTLIQLFKNESSVYLKSSRQVNIFDATFNQVIIQMCSGNRKNAVKQLDELLNTVSKNTESFASRREIIESINWLYFSKVIGLCDQCVDGKLTNIQTGKRMYYMDCGIAYNLINKVPGIDKSSMDGIMTETFVFNELYKLHLSNSFVYKVKGENPCFSTPGTYELDFIEQDIKGKVYGIEVKTKDGDPKSLKIYIQKGLIDKGILAKKTAWHKGIKIDSIPIWAVGCRFPYS